MFRSHDEKIKTAMHSLDTGVLANKLLSFDARKALRQEGATFRDFSRLHHASRFISAKFASSLADVQALTFVYTSLADVLLVRSG